jgi:hypothetical protein
MLNFGYTMQNVAFSHLVQTIDNVLEDSTIPVNSVQGMQERLDEIEAIATQIEALLDGYLGGV